MKHEMLKESVEDGGVGGETAQALENIHSPEGQNYVCNTAAGE